MIQVDQATRGFRICYFGRGLHYFILFSSGPWRVLTEMGQNRLQACQVSTE